MRDSNKCAYCQEIENPKVKIETDGMVFWVCEDCTEEIKGQVIGGDFDVNDLIDDFWREAGEDD